MGIIITESGRDFGEFAEDNLFYIEQSDLLNKLGSGIKTVEFITRLDASIIIVFGSKNGMPESIK